MAIKGGESYGFSELADHDWDNDSRANIQGQEPVLELVRDTYYNYLIEKCTQVQLQSHKDSDIGHIYDLGISSALGIKRISYRSFKGEPIRSTRGLRWESSVCQCGIGRIGLDPTRERDSNFDRHPRAWFLHDYVWFNVLWDKCMYVCMYVFMIWYEMDIYGCVRVYVWMYGINDM